MSLLSLIGLHRKPTKQKSSLTMELVVGCGLLFIPWSWAVDNGTADQDPGWVLPSQSMEWGGHHKGVVSRIVVSPSTLYSPKGGFIFYLNAGDKPLCDSGGIFAYVGQAYEPHHNFEAYSKAIALAAELQVPVEIYTHNTSSVDKGCGLGYLEVDLTGSQDTVDPSQSTLSLSENSAIADGKKKVTATLQLANSQGQPIQATTQLLQKLQITVSGSAEKSPLQLQDNGQAIFTLSDAVAQTVTVSAQYDNKPLKNSPATLIFNENNQKIAVTVINRVSFCCSILSVYDANSGKRLKTIKYKETKTLTVPVNSKLKFNALGGGTTIHRSFDKDTHLKCSGSYYRMRCD